MSVGAERERQARPIIEVSLPGDELPFSGYSPEERSSLDSLPYLELEPAHEFPYEQLGQICWAECSRDGAKMSHDQKALAFTDPFAPEDVREIAREWMLTQGGRLSYPKQRDITPSEVLAQIGIMRSRVRVSEAFEQVELSSVGGEYQASWIIQAEISQEGE